MDEPQGMGVMNGLGDRPHDLDLALEGHGCGCG
jgi:hypothetical protein